MSETKPKLKRCPCGETPKSIDLSDWRSRQKWVMATAGCCSEWTFEFKANYEDEKDKVQLLAEAAWNEMPRGDWQ